LFKSVFVALLGINRSRRITTCDYIVEIVTFLAVVLFQKSIFSFAMR